MYEKFNGTWRTAVLMVLTEHLQTKLNEKIIMSSEWDHKEMEKKSKGKIKKEKVRAGERER